MYSKLQSFIATYYTGDTVTPYHTDEFRQLSPTSPYYNRLNYVTWLNDELQHFYMCIGLTEHSPHTGASLENNDPICATREQIDDINAVLADWMQPERLAYYGLYSSDDDDAYWSDEEITDDELMLLTRTEIIHYAGAKGILTPDFMLSSEHWQTISFNQALHMSRYVQNNHITYVSKLYQLVGVGRVQAPNARDLQHLVQQLATLEAQLAALVLLECTEPYHAYIVPQSGAIHVSLEPLDTYADVARAELRRRGVTPPYTRAGVAKVARALRRQDAPIYSMPHDHDKLEQLWDELR